MIELPPIEDVMKRAQALATLDLILSPEWDSRYYSFNCQWSSDERMASMRNGSGDEWWIVHHRSGWAALKGLDHESEAWNEGRSALSEQLQELIPEGYGDFAREPAFVWHTTSFAYVYWSETRSWTRANNGTEFPDLDAGEDWLLELLIGSPSAYVSYASEYFERDVPLSIVEHVFALRPITDEVVAALNPDVTYAEIAAELETEIGYPKS
jgi:hypothetical protein